MYMYIYVFGKDVRKFKYPLTELLISDTNFEKAVTEIKNVDDYLHQKTPLNSVQSLKLQRHRNVHFGYNRTHLTGWFCWLLA